MLCFVLVLFGCFVCLLLCRKKYLLKCLCTYGEDGYETYEEPLSISWVLGWGLC